MMPTAADASPIQIALLLHVEYISKDSASEFCEIPRRV